MIGLGNGGFLFDCCCVLHISTRISSFKSFGITFSIRDVQLLSFNSLLCLVIFIDINSLCNESVTVNIHVSLIAKCFKRLGRRE